MKDFLRKTFKNKQPSIKIGRNIGYMRVSTDLDKQHFDLQYDAFIKAGVSQDNIFKDVQSGGDQNRPGLDLAIDALQEGDCLVVWKIDRLGRSLMHLLELMQQIRGKKAGFKSLTESFDTTTPHGDLFFNLMAALAQYERALLKERINAGIAAARSRGRIGGRPQAINTELSEKIEKGLQEGMSKVLICKTFGVKKTTLHNHLKQRKQTQ